MVAATFSKTANLMFSTDYFVGEKVTTEFSPSELSVLQNHLNQLTPLVDAALANPESVWGARIAGHFKLKQFLPSLRAHLLEPHRCYGWEGPDPSDPESSLLDMQFMYSIVYLEETERITGKPIGETIKRSAEEKRMLATLVANPGSEYHFWAIWLERKFARR